VIVGPRLVREARRCREQWRSLQELGGIHNSHALRLLERESAAWEESARRDAEARASVESPSTDAPAAGAAQTAAPPSAPAEPTEKKMSDDAFIETPRCSSCNECIKINDRMFRYDRNKQAFIADPSAGTYAQLVLAAESCQVAIIHPGKPRDPNEPGLEELLKRAEPFR
jgi:ferredoxin